MLISSPSCTGNIISGGFLRRECKLSVNPRRLSVFKVNGRESSQMITSRKFMFSRMAIGSNVNENTDDMYDELLNKYGKAIFKSNDQKSARQEVDDDAESLALAVALANVASDVKAADIKVFFVKPLVYWAKFFIVATAFSMPQIDAIGSRIRDLAEQKYGRTATGDSKPNSWTLLDFDDVVVHIFLPQQRAFYNLEKFYGNAKQIDLPLENQQQLSS